MTAQQDKNWDEALRRIERADQTHTKRLDLAHLKLTSIPEEIARLSYVKHLILSHNQIKSIPHFLCGLTNLIELDLDHNELTSIPDSFEGLASLSILELQDNKFISFPEAVFRLPKLKRLDIGTNRISQIPDIPNSHSKLEGLYIHNNKLKVLPESLVNLQNLTTLFVGNNQIAVLPDSIGDFRKLEMFQLRYNELSLIPNAISKLSSLRILNVAENNISSIPHSLSKLPNLAQIELAGNPLPEEVFAAWQQGLPSLFRYLNSTATRKVYPRTVKLVLLGEPKAGKTTLLEALRGNQQPCDETRQETLGVNVVTIEKQHPRDHMPMYLSAWDFAGQHIEHATHQFFLTENAVFVVLWSSRVGAAAGKHDLWYWLELLRMRVREPKFLLVATHTEHTPPDLNLADIERSYPGLQGSFAVELCSLKGVEALEKKILELAAESPSLRAEWPPEWLTVRDEIRKLRKKTPYMHPKSFRKLMEDHGVTDRELQKDLASQLHHLGEILYFQDRDELANIVILDPEWVTELIALVVRSQEVREHKGMLRRQDLEELWKQSNLQPEVREHLIRLMDWFDLTYSTGHATDLGIVVEALPYSKPEELKEIELSAEQPQMEMIYRFPSLQRHLPPGIPTWGIARAHRYSRCMPWKDAAAFTDDFTKSQALILASDVKKEVRLRVSADYPPFFFGQLQAILLDTFKRYPGATPELLFPCPCRPGCTFSHPYETVLKRRRANKDVVCQDSGEDVSVEALLSGARRRPETVEGWRAVESELRRRFTEQRRSQNEQLEKKCPSVFTLVPSRDFQQIDTWLESITQGEELELALYCEYDPDWHPTSHSLYRFKPDLAWFDQVKKSWNKLVMVTKHVGPLAKAVGKAGKLVGLEVAGMAAEKLPEISRSAAPGLAEALGEKEKPELVDIEMRFLLEQLINHLDSSRSTTEPKFGGLHPHLVEDGRLLWLCPEHLKMYRSRA
jgi:internalin A